MRKFQDPGLLLTEVASFLGGNGLGTVNTNLFKQTMPGTPVVCTVVYHTGGPSFPGNPMHFPTFGIQHRNTHVSSGLATVKAIGNLLNDRWNVLPTIQGKIAITGEMGGYYLDSNGHPIHVLNFAMATTQQLH